MYLSCLLIDVGEDPDRPRPGRLWLRNLYRVHQRLCMAFPSPGRVSDDADFLKPFKPEDFGSGQVHVARATDAGFLFRIDPRPGGRVVILVQSACEPDWDYAFRNAGYLLAAPPQVKPFAPSFAEGRRLRFRLLANPTKKIDTIGKGERLGHTQEELRKLKGRHGRRVPVDADQLYEWLAGKTESGGFSIDEGSTTVQPTYIYVNKTRNGDGQRLRSVRYDGILKITDPARFQETLIRGIGPGKAFGFGLLSVAPSDR
jgi:CRISPR system Cascade subunit CasE